jgi:heme-degrading monooxygenase HmoA
MQEKRSALSAAEGLIGSDGWLKCKGSAGFTLITKWKSGEDFKRWFAAAHKNAHSEHNANSGHGGHGKKLATYQFEAPDVVA